MNFKKKFLVAFLIISVLLLSSCEVYKTLYGAPSKPSIEPSSGQVARLESDKAKDPSNLMKMLYASASPTPHDLFKTGEKPLGAFPEGKPLGFTLEKWLSAGGIGIYTVNGENAELELSLKKLVPNGVYTVWCSRITFPPEPKTEGVPCGAEDGSQNSFNADAQGNGAFSLKMKKLPDSTKETSSAIAVHYHSDGKTYGASPGDFGVNAHVQLFYMIPVPAGNATSYEVPIKFTNFIDSGFPEQDVFVEVEKKPEVVVNITKVGEMPKEEKPITEEKPEEAAPKVIKRAEPTGEKSKEKPVVVIVQETEKVSLVPKAEDPDKNASLVFTFTSPLNDRGEWQTTYGDAGEFTVTVTASDGELTTSRDVLIIVNKKEEPPAIDSAKPIESGLTIDETQSIDFDVAASDLNKDPLTYTWKLDGTEVGKDTKYTYQTDYDSAGSHTVKADVSDGISSASRIWSVNVKNVNRKPVLEKISDIHAKETDKIVITALATDADKDAITYSISDKRFAQEVNVFTWQTDYDSAGTYEVTVSASDGQDKADQAFTVTVSNVDRPPMIIDIVQKK